MIRVSRTIRRSLVVAFADALDGILRDGPGRDIYIYVHGHKVVFENAVAVSTELWHYLDYEGALIAFAWPATPRRLACLGDLETAEASATRLSRFIDYLAEQTPARRIHVIGYSAGSRVVTSALSRLALASAGARSDAQSTVSRIGQVVLVGSDMLMMLRFGLEPGERGLERSDESTVWVFPPDYIARLAAAVAKTGGDPPAVHAQPAAKQ
jgi:pimeloyl-ACP methyl ester carboxylesterase